jgi:hypothetical protein
MRPSLEGLLVGAVVRRCKPPRADENVSVAMTGTEGPLFRRLGIVDPCEALLELDGMSSMGFECFGVAAALTMFRGLVNAVAWSVASASGEQKSGSMIDSSWSESCYSIEGTHNGCWG